MTYCGLSKCNDNGSHPPVEDIALIYHSARLPLKTVLVNPASQFTSTRHHESQKFKTRVVSLRSALKQFFESYQFDEMKAFLESLLK